MKLVNNQETRYEASSDAAHTADAVDADGAADTQQLSLAMAMPEEENDNVVQQNIVAVVDDDDTDDADDEIVVMSGLLLASMNNIVSEMEKRRRESSSNGCLPRRRRLDSRDGPSSSQIPEALTGTGTRSNTAVRRRFAGNADNDSDVVATPRSDKTMSVLIDEALRVVGGDKCRDDETNDFHFMKKRSSSLWVHRAVRAPPRSTHATRRETFSSRLTRTILGKSTCHIS
jgi:hypothetical protein